jgi:hypothetical protein
MLSTGGIVKERLVAVQELLKRNKILMKGEAQAQP